VCGGLVLWITLPGERGGGGKREERDTSGVVWKDTTKGENFVFGEGGRAGAEA